MKRLIILNIHNSSWINLENDFPEKGKIIRIWTILDPNATGYEPLAHNEKFYVNERMHDWYIKDKQLFFNTRTHAKNEILPGIVIEYKD